MMYNLGFELALREDTVAVKEAAEGELNGARQNTSLTLQLRGKDQASKQPIKLRSIVESLASAITKAISLECPPQSHLKIKRKRHPFSV
ncbi:hypothetical protein RRG08_000605 [Elysia crispata]|uniref:Uncharacterized protein n=1 Tax=Elysia crispata TaxID=231223 RepID=A0AAE0Y982_9GAST|nr:hypothetical protein RRG08_000605 [Elysia crispata]